MFEFDSTVFGNASCWDYDAAGQCCDAVMLFATRILALLSSILFGCKLLLLLAMTAAGNNSGSKWTAAVLMCSCLHLNLNAMQSAVTDVISAPCKTRLGTQF